MRINKTIFSKSGPFFEDFSKCTLRDMNAAYHCSVKCVFDVNIPCTWQRKFSKFGDVYGTKSMPKTSTFLRLINLERMIFVKRR